MDKPKYEMRMSLNVLNHLGLNLYSNVPAVLSEVVANSWDADATSVEIVIEQERDKIIITDDGHGMSETEINRKYLNVGYERRKNEQVRTPKHDRPVMGRKGIGKLSLFSIAETVVVHTVKDREKSGFVMSVADIKAAIEKEGSTYHPEPLDESEITLGKEGTQIILTDLKKRVSRTTSIALRKRLARRFSIIGTEHNFDVTIDGTRVTAGDRDYFDKLQYMWHYGDGSEKSKESRRLEKLEHTQKRTGTFKGPGEGDADSVNYRVRGWIGTVRKSGDLNTENGGDNLNKIVVMVRGKLAQEDILEDFSEGGLYTKYIIGEIHADFLDQDDSEDIATTNRQEIIKDDPRYRALQNWVRGELKHIQSRWTDLRKEQGEQEARKIDAIDKWLERLNSGERRQAKSLFGKIGQLTLDENDKAGLYQQCVLAFENIRYKGKLEALEQITPENLDAVTQIFAALDDIEASLYYRIVQERLRVIEALRAHVTDNAKEKVVQEYLYEHLWLLDPSWDRATETPLMEQSVTTAFAKIDSNLTDEERRGRFDIKYKMTSGKHVIIELKRADQVLSEYDLGYQVGKYRNALLKLVETTGKNEPVEVVCIVGKPLTEWKTPVQQEESKKSLAVRDIRVVLYNELIEDAYRNYQAFLDKNREAGRVYRLIRDIGNRSVTHKLGGGPDEPNC